MTCACIRRSWHDCGVNGYSESGFLSTCLLSTSLNYTETSATSHSMKQPSSNERRTWLRLLLCGSSFWTIPLGFKQIIFFSTNSFGADIKRNHLNPLLWYLSLQIDWCSKRLYERYLKKFNSITQGIKKNVWFLIGKKVYFYMILSVGVKNFSNSIERPIFWNFKITNIKITKDELIDSFIFEFIFSLFINYLHSLIIFQIGKY